MPNRIIKESIRTSDTLSSVSADAERLFWRIVVSADDFGRFDARPKVILGQCLSSFIGEIDIEKVKELLAELVRVNLISIYRTDDEGMFLQLTNWSKHQTIRAKKSKFPSPPEVENNCMQMQAKVPVFVFENENVFGNVNENEANEESPEEDVSLNETQESKHSLSSSDVRLAKVSRLYQESGMGQLDETAKTFLLDWLELYSDEWIENAFREAVLQNKRRPKYVNSILQNWATEGGMRITLTASSRREPNTHGRSRESPKPSEYGEDVRNAFYSGGWDT